MENKKSGKLLGILGGLGPMATAYFYELLTALTVAECDQDHIDMVISSRASTPDRTSFILGKSDANPLSIMIEEVKRLEAYGADLIAIPCNTAHYFYDGIAKEASVPILNIITETVELLSSSGVSRAALFATEGTCRSGTYQTIGRDKVDIVVPPEDEQRKITSFIYDDIKRGASPNIDEFLSLAEKMRERGCERIILGCTELSLIKKNFDVVKFDDFYVDSLEVLARKTVISCGKPCRERI